VAGDGKEHIIGVGPVDRQVVDLDAGVIEHSEQTPQRGDRAVGRHLGLELIADRRRPDPVDSPRHTSTRTGTIFTMPKSMSQVESEVAQLTAHGRQVLSRLLRTAGSGPDTGEYVERLLELVASRAESWQLVADLPPEEQKIWESAGARFADNGIVAQVELDSVQAIAELVDRSIRGVAALAEYLGVDRSRISQRMAEGSLYSFTVDGDQRLFPQWEFKDRKPLQGLRTVFGALDSRLHPLTVDNWFTTPDADLAAGDEQFSPAEWLATGGSPDKLVDLVPEV